MKYVLGMMQFCSAVAVIVLSTQLADAAGAGDCYLLIVKDNATGAASVIGCPSVDCDTGPGTTPCVANTFASYEYDPATQQSTWVTSTECLCGATGGGSKPCNLYSFPTSTGFGVSCRTRNCNSPKDCELPTPFWKAFCVDPDGDGNYDCDEDVAMAGDCLCK